MKVLGELRARRTIIRGDVHCEPGHERILLGFFEGVGNTVYGDVQIKGGVGPGFSGVLGAMIHGDLQAEENSNGLLFGNNVIGGDLHVFKNTGILPEDGSSANIGVTQSGATCNVKKMIHLLLSPPCSALTPSVGTKKISAAPDLAFER